MNSNSIVSAVRVAIGNAEGPILLHAPTFAGNEWSYVKQCIDTGWVSSAGSYVTQFERQLEKITGSAHAIAVVNGTAALHVALKLAGVEPGTEVLMPSLTFIATANAASYCGAIPHFCDVEGGTLGLDSCKLAEHLTKNAILKDGVCENRTTGRRIAAVVPMHTFGHPVDIEGVAEVARQWNLPLVEDAAESLGSYYNGRHTGTFGKLGVLSFNGNKIITTGGGGAILTDDEALAKHARHLTTTAKLSHPWEYVHDEIGYNYRMPNLNAALGCAQLEQLDGLLIRKRQLAERYHAAFAGIDGVEVFRAPVGSTSNHWLNAIVLRKADKNARDAALNALNAAGFQSRPLWTPMHRLAMYKSCPKSDLGVTESLECRIINVPSSASLA